MTVILDIDHEAGNLNEWSATTGKVSASATAALGGSDYGMLVDIDDTTVDHCSKTLTYNTSGIWRTRFYFNADDVTFGSNGLFIIFKAYNGSYAQLFDVYLHYESYAKKIRFYYRTEAGLQEDASYVISSGDHYVEVLYKQGDGTGEFKTWIDGVAKSNKTSLNNDNISTYNGIYYVRAGDVTSPPSGTTGDLYIDEIIINDTGDKIGPNSTDYSMVCEAGSYSLTGSAANLILQRNYSLICAAGSYVLAGTDINLVLQRNYRLSLEPGSYILTGTDVGLFLNLILYTQTVRFTVFLNKTVQSQVQLNKSVDSPVQLNKIVSSPALLNKTVASKVELNKIIEMTEYSELEKTE